MNKNVYLYLCLCVLKMPENPAAQFQKPTLIEIKINSEHKYWQK